MKYSLLIIVFLLNFSIRGFSGEIDGGGAKQVASEPTIQIYQTAQETSDRLTKLDDVALDDFGQPKEYQPCVFIDPAALGLHLPMPQQKFMPNSRKKNRMSL